MARPISRPIRDLLEGDCFFWIAPEERTRREKEVLAIDEFRRAHGEELLTASERMAFFSTFLSGYMVYAVVRATGERCVQSMSDGKVRIWYDCDVVVQFTPDRSSFQYRLEEMKAVRKRLEQEQQRMNRTRSKKANRAAQEMEGAA